VGLDLNAFANALEDGSAERAFREDRQECEALQVTGFPTFTIGRGEVSARLNGWQPWEVFEDVVRKVDPSIVPEALEPSPASVIRLLGMFERWATREVAAVLGVTDDDAELLLEELEGKGRIVRQAVGKGLVWRASDPRALDVTEEADRPADRISKSP
jgi:hypothetical protein